ncbi:MAG: ribbon-helix-helix protein, CopG family [Actinomycetota bacterium]|nr:ribbon-helix-helix protein, CopG family [Actinomycetota bacterium]
MLSRRLQVLIDDDRWERLERRSAETGASVGEVVRRAIDEALPAVDRSQAIAAMERFLATPPMPVDDWDVMKREMLEELYGERRE